MSQDQDQPAKDEAQKEAVATPPAAKSRKKLVIIGAAAALVVLGGGGGAYMMLGGKAEAAAGEHGKAAEGGHGAADEGDDGGGGDGEGGESGGENGAAKPFDVPPILVNLQTSDGSPKFLKVHVMLMPGDGVSEETLKEKLPILLDSYQPFLRELRPEDLSGSAAVFRIKEELLIRSRDALGEGQVKEVLVQDLIQQ